MKLRDIAIDFSVIPTKAGIYFPLLIIISGWVGIIFSSPYISTLPNKQ